MFNPHVGRVTSEYGSRGGGFHAGIDIAPPTPGTAGTPVYAAFAGTVTKTVSSRSPGQSASSGTVLAPGRSGNGLIIRNADGERQLYNHVRPVVAVGAKVKEGQVIGYTDRSGIQTGPHLHFEIWTAAGKTRNPRVDFTAFGITPGKASTPAPKPPPKPPTGGSASVRAYQERQNKHGKAGLVVDGKDGKVTQAWEAWVKKAQAALNHYKGVQGKVVVDGDYGADFARQVGIVQERNGLVVDKVLGNVMAAWMRKQGSSLPNRPSNRP